MEAGERGALKRAKENYRYFPEVRAVGFGSKFTDGARLPDVRAIQFFVTSKIADEDLKRSLPRFVYGRRADGSVDHEQRIPTDVIDIGALELCCAAGDRLDRVGGNGAATLIFRNKAPDGRLLLLTCSHVVGDLATSPQPGQLVGGHAGCIFQANVLANTVLSGERLEFDIALAEIFSHGPGLMELAVAGTPAVLNGFVEAAALSGDVSCVSPESGPRTVTIESAEAEFREILTDDGRRIAIGNLIACKGEAVKGDSGGIVFTESNAAGIVVARGTNGWVLIHPLKEAVTHLSSVAGIPVECFA